METLALYLTVLPAFVISMFAGWIVARTDLLIDYEHSEHRERLSSEFLRYTVSLSGIAIGSGLCFGLGAEMESVFWSGAYGVLIGYSAFLARRYLRERGDAAPSN